ncbi:MAG: HRDC domain-containing protein [Thermodesulfobacteriota bacterium]|nr:HRDC domain-containing protein [Thermodesulfobacteriota bacterium]
MSKNINRDYQLIETLLELKTVTDLFKKEKAIAVDLEADSMYHFKEKVCLIQMATHDINVVIDPLKIHDLSPLKPLFENRSIKKIFHGADYDVRSLYRDFKININNLFDTQLACMFLGVSKTGLEAAVKKWFKVSLDKKYQRKDWSKRPLSGDMITYAAKDALYLLPLAEILEEKLKTLGRLSWVNEECRYLSKVRHASANHYPLYLKFNGAGRLDSRSLAVLEALLQYRKKIAKKEDRPLFKILGNNSLMKLTTTKPCNLSLVGKTKALSPRQIRMHGDAVINIINNTLKVPGGSLPVYPRKKASPLPPQVPKRIKAIKAWRDTIANKMKIDPSLLFNKALLTAIALQNPKDKKSLETIKGMKNWQKNEFGESIISILETMDN